MGKLYDLLNTLIGKVNATVKTVNGVSPDAAGNVQVEGGGTPADAVLYTAQTLTTDQKTQARTNIGAQATLTFDTAPKSGSKNPVTSGGVYAADEDLAALAAAGTHAGLAADGTALNVRFGDICRSALAGNIAMDSFVHVSDKVPTLADLKQGFTIVYGDPSGDDVMSGVYADTIELLPYDVYATLEGSTEVADEIYGAGVYDLGDGAYLLGEMVVIIPYDGYAFEEAVFPKAGVYFYMFTTTLRINGYSFADDISDAGEYFETVTRETVTEVGDTLTWDGNKTGRTAVSIGSDAWFVKISDSIPHEEDVVQGMTATMSNGYIYEPDYVKYKTDGEVAAISLGYLAGNGNEVWESFIFVIPGAGNFGGLEFSEPGIYFFGSVGSFVNSLTIYGYNFTCTEPVTETTIKTEHLPEALRFGDIRTTTYSDTLTWDGDTTEKIVSNGLCKVSDVVLTAEQLAGVSSVSITESDGTETIITDLAVGTEENEMSYISNSGGTAAYVYVLYTAVEDLQAGIYFKYGDDVYVSSVTIPGAFPQVKEEVRTIDPRYLPESAESVILRSSTEGSSRKFKITVDDSGTLTATEITE